MTRIESFLKMYSSKKTVATYKWALSEYFKSVYGSNENHLEEYAERYFEEKRSYEEDIQNFLAKINEKPPKSVRLMIAAVRSFLIENDVELPEKFWRRLMGRVKGTRALTLDEVPSNVELRKITTHMPVHGKALYLILSSSGMRIGEALKLTLEDLDLNQDPVKISIRGEYTKTGNSRIAFISAEAKESIEEWLKVRSQYLDSAIGKSHRYGKKAQDARIFPFESVTAYMVWKGALEKSGFLKVDKSTNRHTIHPHVLRKFFRTKLGSVIPVDVVEALMGHEGYLTEVYRRYTTEDLAKFYKQGEQVLQVFGVDAEQFTKMKEALREDRDNLQRLVNGQSAKLIELENKDQEQSREIKALKEQVQGLGNQYSLLFGDSLKLGPNVSAATLAKRQEELNLLLASARRTEREREEQGRTKPTAEEIAAWHRGLTPEQRKRLGFPADLPET